MSTIATRREFSATNPDLSIVIPAFNEERRIALSLVKLGEYLSTQTQWNNPEVIVVCDGCDDDTESIVRSFAVAIPCLRVVSYPVNRGKGHALKRGVADSRGSLLLIADADLSTPMFELPRLTARITAQDADIVIGSRRIRGANITTPQPMHRRILGNSLSVFTRVIAGLPFKDTQCGFKVFRGDVARELFKGLTCENYGFDMHILSQALSLGYRVHECGVEWSDSAGSHVRPLKDGLRILSAAWAARRRAAVKPRFHPKAAR